MSPFRPAACPTCGTRITGVRTGRVVSVTGWRIRDTRAVQVSPMTLEPCGHPAGSTGWRG
jgi:hypothetical protein